MKRWIVMGLCAAVGLPACRQTRSDLVFGTGTMLVTGDCHAWHIEADSGRFYELHDLSPEFQHWDLRVRFVLRERKDSASNCMVGAIADVVSLTKLN